MKEYHVQTKENEAMVYNNRENAEKFAKERGLSVKEKNVYSYYSPYESNRNVRFAGENLKDAIEKKFNAILVRIGFIGASGYHLESVTLDRKNDTTAILTVTGWQYSEGKVGFKGFLECDKKIETLDINGVEDSDFEKPIIFEYV